MSSHREAPEISKDPVADSTDVYAFVSPDEPTTVTLISNYIPLEAPAAGPNFYEFGDDVLYQIHIDPTGAGTDEIVYSFRFTTEVTNPDTFLYNTGPITRLDSPNWNRRQSYSVTRTHGHRSPELLGTGLACPPCNIGPLSTPNYPALAALAVHQLPGGRTVFAGQRAEGFYVDLGAVFELGVLRPFAPAHFGHLPLAAGVNATKLVNVHSIAIKVPITDLVGVGQSPVVGVYASASRPKVRILFGASNGEDLDTGPQVQVSRLGNPLFNEVLVPMSKKDHWNASAPKDDQQFLAGVAHPELSRLLNVLYPNVFPNLAGYTKARADLIAILLTGIPAGIVPGFPKAKNFNYTGSTQADLLRLNTSIPPNTGNPSRLGVLGGDVAGFPNGRRVADDVFTIELRALAGATIPLVDSGFTPDGAAGAVTDGVTFDNYINHFPYLGEPYSGYDVPAS